MQKYASTTLNTFTSMENSPCDFVWKARDNQPKPLTREVFMTLLNGSDTKMMTEKVRMHDAQSEVYKIQLPAVTWQASFGGKLRNDANAIPSGFYCIDVDIHHEQKFLEMASQRGQKDAIEWATQEARARAERWAKMQKEDDSDCWNGEPLGIVGIHISPSGTGVHVIAVCDGGCKTIAENQARLARILGTSYDEVCKDWARIFFISPREDWTYLDMDAIFGYED